MFLLQDYCTARQNVLNEARGAQPGGVFVLADSVQMADSAKFAAVMENFRRASMSPTTATTGDDIDARLVDAGFEEYSRIPLHDQGLAARKPSPEATQGFPIALYEPLPAIG